MTIEAFAIVVIVLALVLLAAAFITGDAPSGWLA